MNNTPIGSGGNRTMNCFWRQNDTNGLAGNFTIVGFKWNKSTAPPSGTTGQPSSFGDDVSRVTSIHTSTQVGFAFGEKLIWNPGAQTADGRYSNYYTNSYSEGYDFAKMWSLGSRQHTKHDICLSATVDVYNVGPGTMEAEGYVPDRGWNPTIDNYTLYQYLHDEIDGVPLYEARPYIANIHVKPFIRKGTQVGGADITDSTARVAYKTTYGGSGGSNYAYYRATGETSDHSGGISIIGNKWTEDILPYWLTGRGAGNTTTSAVLTSQVHVTPLNSDGIWTFGWGSTKASCQYNNAAQINRDPPTTNVSAKQVTVRPINVESAYANWMYWVNPPGPTYSNWAQFNFIAWYYGRNIVALMNSLGFDWAETEAIAQTGNPGDEGYNVPLVDEGGKPTGETDPDPDPDDDVWNGGGKGPNDPPEDEEGEPLVNDPEHETTPTNPPGLPEDPDTGDTTNPEVPPLPAQPLGTVSDVSGQKKFAMTLAEVNGLRAFLNSTYAPTDADLIADFKGRNPFDYIVSLKLYPFLHNAGAAENIVVGKVGTGVSGKPLIDGVKYLDFGYVDIPVFFGNFMDYEPYTTIRLTVPFCGSIELDPSIYVGHRVALQGVVDYNTGSMTAIVFLDGYQMETLEGVACIDLPVFGTEQGDYQNAIYDAQFALRMAKTGEKKAILGGMTFTSGTISPSAGDGGDVPVSSQAAAGGMVTGVASMVTNFAGAAINLSTARDQVNRAEWKLDHTAPRVGTIGSASALNNFVLNLVPKLTITRSMFIEGINVDMYGRTVGYACLKTGKVGDFRGFTQFADVKFIGSTMLASERDMVRSLLGSGIIV